MRCVLIMTIRKREEHASLYGPSAFLENVILLVKSNVLAFSTKNMQCSTLPMQMKQK